MEQYLDHLIAEGFEDSELSDEEKELLRVKNSLKEGIREYQEEKGFKMEMPEIAFENTVDIWSLAEEENFQHMTQKLFKEEDYELVFPELFLNGFDSRILKRRAKSAIKELIEYRFSEFTDESLEKLGQIYDEAEAEVDEITVSDMDRSVGLYNDENKVSGRTISYDFSLVNLIDMKTGEVLKKPKTFSEEDNDPIQKRPKDVTDHEVAHATQFQNNPHPAELSNHISNEVAGTEDKDYQYDIRRASMEAITTFEEELNQEGEKSIWEKEVENPFSLAELIKHNASPGEELLYDNPYNLGKVAAFNIDVALREEHGDQKGRELAREYLLDVTTTPKGLEGAIENSLEMRGLPNIHEKIRNRYEQLKSAEDTEKEILEATKQVNSGFGETLDRSEAIDVYNEYQALECAYNELENTRVPERATELVREAEELFRR